MIVIKTIKFSNIFSYGKNNYLELDTNQITQILGINGAGKSSIPLILEEGLFSKNSKNIKKGDLLNRYTKDKSFYIEISFEKDLDHYTISTVRSTTQTIKIIKNDTEDISCHTSTQTLKLLESILGFSYETFVSLIYQSSAQSMEFLTATDTVRKKFLIELLGLTKYTEAFEVFKEASKEVSISVLEAETKLSTIQSWLDKNSKIDLTAGVTKEVPEEPRGISEQVGILSLELKNIDETNKQIIKNNQYKKVLDSIVLDTSISVPDSNENLIKERAELEAAKKQAELQIKKAKELKDTCPTCKQSVDISFVPSLIKDNESIASTASIKLEQIQKALNLIAADTIKFKEAERNKQEFENYSNLFDSKLNTELKDKDDLRDKLNNLEGSIKTIQASIKEVLEFNRKILAKNTQIEVIIQQSDNMRADLSTISLDLKILTNKLAILEILKKSFSTSGLLAYKIECLVKDLESITNEYLGDLSAGRFQLSFKVSNDKLNVIITDNGIDVDISTLSSGEKARVNTATLLAIRKLMQALSSTKVNLLILDETIDSLDVDGKEKLIEVLLNEVGLNTFLISHGYTHPLLEKITVIKENNISRLE